MAEYDADGWQVLEHEPDRTAEDADSATPDGAPEPWYRNRVLLALWALMVALLLTLVIYGIVELSRGGGETGGPATTTSSTTPTRSSTTSPTTTPSTPTPSSTTESPPPETPEQTPEEAPPPANNSPSPAPPTRHHHHLHLPHFF
jgi:cytoskeletal protein RodZ